MRVEMVKISDLEDVFQAIKLEQTFRAQLHLFKEHQELALKKAQECKQTAERLHAMKQKLRGYNLLDKETNKEVFKMMNKSFKGGMIK